MTTLSRNEGSAKITWILLLLVLVIAASILLSAGLGENLSAWIPGTHAVERHGAEVAEVRSMFSNDGRCNKGPSVEMYSADNDRWIYICFHENEKASIWIMAKRLIFEDSREITAIPRTQMRNPVSYIRNAITKGNYELRASYGNVPSWFENIIEVLVSY